MNDDCIRHSPKAPRPPGHQVQRHNHYPQAGGLLIILLPLLPTCRQIQIETATEAQDGKGTSAKTDPPSHKHKSQETQQDADNHTHITHPLRAHGPRSLPFSPLATAKGYDSQSQVLGLPRSQTKLISNGQAWSGLTVSLVNAVRLASCRRHTNGHWNPSYIPLPPSPFARSTGPSHQHSNAGCSEKTWGTAASGGRCCCCGRRRS